MAAIWKNRPYLEPEDRQAALNYAAWLAEESVYTLERAAGHRC